MSTARNAWVVDVSEEDFEREVIERSREVPVVVDFWSPSCGPCRMLGPMLEAAAAERAGEFVLAKVNLDHAHNLAMSFGIEAVPTVQAFRDGRASYGFVGLLPEEQLREYLNRICLSPADKLVRQAKELETPKPAEAERLYQEALALQPDHGGALLGMVRVLIARNQDEEAEQRLSTLRVNEETAEEVDRLEHLLVLRRLGRSFGSEADARKRVEADPKNAERLYELGCVLAREGRHVEALETLLAAAERNPTLARGKVREAMVEVFQVLGASNPLTGEYQKKLSLLLY